MTKYIINIKYLNTEHERKYEVKSNKQEILNEMKSNFIPDSKITKITINYEEEIIINMNHVEYIHIRRHK